MEINIQKKKKPVWPWILALIILGVIIWFVYTQYGEEVEEQIDTTIENTTSQNNEMEDISEPIEVETAYYDEVKDFIYFVENHHEQVGLQTNYTARATVYLAHAISTLVNKEHSEDEEINAKRLALLRTAELLIADTTSITNTIHIKEAFNHAVELLAFMQKKDYPQLKPEMNNLERVAKSLVSEDGVAPRLSDEKEFLLYSKLAIQAISEIDTF